MDDNVRFESIQDETADSYGGFDFRMDGGTTEPYFVVRKNAGDPILHVDGGGNVGIGTTNPDSRLEVNGEIDANGGDGYKIEGRPWANWGSDLLTLGDWDGEGYATRIMGSNSSEVMRVTGTNVGIGTTSPTNKLQVTGGSVGVDSEYMVRDNRNNTILLQSASTAASNRSLTIGNATYGNIIVPNGNVGIGATSPGYKLDVSGDAYIDETLNIETTISGTLQYGYGGVGAGHLVVGGNNFASFTPAVITLMNQDTTISPGQDLGVLQFGGKDDLTNGYANGQIICTTAVGAGSGNTGGGIFRFLLSGNTTGSAPTERMRITNTGNVGIGTTSPAKKLTIGGIGIGNTDGLKIEDPSNTAYGAHYSYDDGSTTVEIGGVVNNTLIDCISIARDATRTITIDTSERVGIGDTTPSYKLDVTGEGRFTGDLRCLTLIQTSQRDQKENINDINKSKAKAIPFKEYTYKSSIDGSSKKRYGVIAEDIENDYPELVHTGADGIKGINYIDLLVKRVAELEKELEDISLTPGPKGDTGAAGANGADGSNGADGNSHLSNVTSIAFNPKANRLEVNIGGTVYNFVPSK